MADKRTGASTGFSWGPSAMDWRSVLEIGIAALEREWIGPAALTKAIELFRKGLAPN